MRIIAVSAVLVAVIIAAPSAQQPDQPVSESVTLALQPSQSLKLQVPPDPFWIAQKPTTLGIFTIAPPETAGEMLRVVVPVGALATRAAHAISGVQQRRAERKARNEVQRALRDFLQSSAVAAEVLK